MLCLVVEIVVLVCPARGAHHVERRVLVHSCAAEYSLRLSITQFWWQSCFFTLVFPSPSWRGQGPRRAIRLPIRPPRWKPDVISEQTHQGLIQELVIHPTSVFRTLFPPTNIMVVRSNARVTGRSASVLGQYRTTNSEVSNMVALFLEKASSKLPAASAQYSIAVQRAARHYFCDTKLSGLFAAGSMQTAAGTVVRGRAIFANFPLFLAPSAIQIQPRSLSPRSPVCYNDLCRLEESS